VLGIFVSGWLPLGMITDDLLLIYIFLPTYSPSSLIPVIACASYEIARMGLYGFFELPAKAPVKPKTLKVSKNDPYSSYTSADYNIPYVPALSGGPDVSAGVYAPIVDDKKTAEAGNAKLNAVDQDDHDLIDTKPASKKKRGRASKVKAEVVNEEQEEGEGGEDVKPIIRKAAKRAKVAAPRKKAAVVKDPDVDEVKEKAKNSRAARAAARMIVKEESY
jgi:hypothetical protein